MTTDMARTHRDALRIAQPPTEPPPDGFIISWLEVEPGMLAPRDLAPEPPLVFTHRVVPSDTDESTA